MEKKVHTLINAVPGQRIKPEELGKDYAIPKDFYANHLADKLRWYDSILEPLHKLWATLKKTCSWLLNALIVLLLVGGLALGWISYQSYIGKPTPFTTIEMIGLENGMQELGASFEQLDIKIANLRMRLEEIEKPKKK